MVRSHEKGLSYLEAVRNEGLVVNLGDGLVTRVSHFYIGVCG